MHLKVDSAGHVLGWRTDERSEEGRARRANRCKTLRGRAPRPLMPRPKWRRARRTSSRCPVDRPRSARPATMRSTQRRASRSRETITSSHCESAVSRRPSCSQNPRRDSFCEALARVRWSNSRPTRPATRRHSCCRKLAVQNSDYSESPNSDALCREHTGGADLRTLVYSDT